MIKTKIRCLGSKYLLLPVCLYIIITNSAFAENYADKSKTNINNELNEQQHINKDKPFTFMYDKYMSPYASAPLYTYARTFFNCVEDKVLFRLQDHIVGRYVLGVANNFLNGFLYILNHEVNGHGFRYKSMNMNLEIEYPLHTFFIWPSFIIPTGGVGVGIRFVGNEYYITFDEELMVTSAGSEANTVLAKEILLNNFHENTINKNSYNLFLCSFSDLSGYIFTKVVHKGDIKHWIQTINDKYSTKQKKITLKHLRVGACTYFLNPFVYMGLYSWYANIITGQKDYPVPNIKLGSVKYLPIIRIGLTPFGLDYHLENFINIKRKTLLLSINVGKSPFYEKAYLGSSIRTKDLFEFDKVSFDLVGAIWYQPHLILSTDKERTRFSNNFEPGFMFGPRMDLKVCQYGSLNLQIFYKTRGFIEGEVAEKGFNFRGGFSIYLF